MVALLASSVLCHQPDALEISWDDMPNVLPLEELAKAPKLSAHFSDALPIKKVDDYFRFFEKVTW